MTEKRFEVTFNDSDFHLKDNEIGEEFKLVDEKVCYDYITDRWNALHEENQLLKKENEKLKIENQGQSDAIDRLQEMIVHYNLEEL